MTTILITGATSGLGKALTVHASKKGYHVIACGRNQQALKELSTLDGVTTKSFDLTDLDQTQLALAKTKFDIAVLNAGTCEYVDVENIDTSLFKRVFDINFFGVVNALSSLIPQAQKGNKIVIVDSMARLLPFTKSQAYGASKAALHYACKSFAVDLASKQIKLQSVSPGFVKTPLTDKNDFSMPMAISADVAAEKMLKGILSNRASVYFPFRFGVLMRFMHLLPESIQHLLCKKMKGQNNNNEHYSDAKELK